MLQDFKRVEQISQTILRPSTKQGAKPKQFIQTDKTGHDETVTYLEDIYMSYKKHWQIFEGACYTMPSSSTFTTHGNWKHHN